MDTLTGGAGNDNVSLIGGAGDDLLTGGAGADTFVFNQLSGIDHITDFTTASDHVSLSKAMFTMLGAVGTLGSTAFYAAAGATTGHLGTDRVIYNTTTGALYYDADGNGSGVAVQIGVLDGHPTLAYTDVLIF
ncbi:MAG: calcium-binding protein [Pseudomonadota bacterium]